MLKKLTPRICYLPNDPATDRPSLGYIQGDKYSLMVDAGASPSHVTLYLEELQQLGHRRPDFVVLTHWHWDHVFGLTYLKELGVLSIACVRTNDYLAKMKAWKWSPEAINDRLLTGEDVPFCVEMMEKEYQGFDTIISDTADITFQDDLTLDLGGITCHFHRIGGPHTKDSVICHVPEEKILFLGDCDCENLFRVPAQEYGEKLRALLQELDALDFKHAIPGHRLDETKEETLKSLHSSIVQADHELYHFPWFENNPE